MDILKRLVLKGFKSIQDIDLELRPLNVLIGPNGAGKSNLVSFFKMLNEMMGGRLQHYIATSGRSQSLLYLGPKKTPQMETRLEFETSYGVDTYEMRLFHAAGDTLVFAEEKLSFHRTGVPEAKSVSLGAGHQETLVDQKADEGDDIAGTLGYLLSTCRVFHFHDTSPTAQVRQYCYVDADRWLMPDGSNLAAFLYRLRAQEDGTAYRRILDTVRLVAPFFDDFDLEPSRKNDREIILNWREKGSDELFGVHQLSDGTLRAICLITLLLQPEKELPGLIVVDEPELGLHPYALNIVASLFRKASHHTQVLVSTQSSPFLDNFDATDVVVVDREEQGSTFQRLDSDKLESWLEDYSLGEVWEKNVIGGGPH
jgi:predicted ATPase